MGVIELGKAISDYGIAIITGIFLVLIVWLVKHLINEQSKTNKNLTEEQNKTNSAILGMFQNELKALHKGDQTNARLNRKSIIMIGALSEYLNRHFNGCADKVNFKKRVNKANGQKK